MIQSIEKKNLQEKVIYETFKTQHRIMMKLVEAFDILIMARLWLKNSYVYAYYLKTNSIDFELFTKQQAMIEHLTELLGELLFKPVQSFDPDVISSKASALKNTLNKFSSSSFSK